MISVIIPVYNVKNYLEECVDSILSQTFSDFELILVDDGSTDGSSEICDRYLSDSRVKVVHKENGGLLSARKAGVEQVKGDYVCFIDSDDYVANDFLLNYNKILEKYNPDVIAINLTRFCNDDRREIKNSAQEGYYENTELDALKKKLIYDDSQGGFNLGVVMFSVCCKCIKASDRRESKDHCGCGT